MSENATRWFESDASTEQPTTDTGRKNGELVHSAGEWRLSVRGDGSVEAHDTTDPDSLTPWTTSDTEVPARESHRVGKTIEGVLARYAHETRFDRDPETENGAVLRREIIDALQTLATDATCGRSQCDGEATHIRHVNAPTGPSTSLVCDECAEEGTYATLHALENVREREVED